MHWLRMTRKGVFFLVSHCQHWHIKERRGGGGSVEVISYSGENVWKILNGSYFHLPVYSSNLSLYDGREIVSNKKRTLLLKWTFNNLPIKMTFTMFWRLANFQKTTNVQNYLKITEIRGGLNVFCCGIDLREDTYEAVNTSLQSQEKSKLMWLNVFTAAHAKRIIAKVTLQIFFLSPQ